MIKADLVRAGGAFGLGATLASAKCPPAACPALKQSGSKSEAL